MMDLTMEYLGVLVSLHQEQDEGDINYLRRLAEKNAYRDWRELAELNGFPLRKKLMPSSMQSLIEGKSTHAKAKRQSKSGISTSKIADGFYRAPADALCPCCLRESEYLRQAWSHRLAVACGVHGRLLIDSCPTCGSSLTRDREKLSYCDCGYDFRAHKSPNAQPHEIWISARLEGRSAPVEGIPEIGSESDYGDLAELLIMLATRFDSTKKISVGRVTLPGTIAETRTLLAAIANLLADYPRAFAEHVAARIVAGPQAEASLSGRLGQWYRALHKICVTKKRFSSLWTTFSDVVYSSFDGKLADKSGLVPSPGHVRAYVTVREAARLVGVSDTAIYSAVDQNILHNRIVGSKAERATMMICREECERLRSMRANWIGIPEVCHLLGIPAAFVGYLVEAGVLQEDLYWKRSIVKGGPIFGGSVSELPVRLACYLKVDKSRPGIPLDKINGRRTVDKKALGKLFKAIFNGEVNSIGREDCQGLGGFIFAHEDVRRYLATAALTDAFTLSQLEVISGWKYECIAQWVRCGLLQSDETVLQGRKAHVVTALAYSTFVKTWKPVADVATALSLPASVITKYLVAQGVSVVGYTDPANGPRRGGLVRMHDLLCLMGIRPESAGSSGDDPRRQ